jgi:hypothetical protein
MGLIAVNKIAKTRAEKWTFEIASSSIDSTCLKLDGQDLGVEGSDKFQRHLE